MTHKQLRAQYTQEFKMEAVRQVRAGQAKQVNAHGHQAGCHQAAKKALNTECVQPACD